MMPHVALLRGVNVGRRKVLMADLRQLAVDLGFADVSTYIQSGNLLLTSPDSPDDVRLILEAGLNERFGWDIPVAVRTGPQMAEAARNCPFQPEGDEVVYVGFLVQRADEDRLAALVEEGRDGRAGDVAEVMGDRVYVLYRHGVHESALSNAWMERRLGVPVTSRNLRTVRELAVRAGALA